MCDFGIDNPKKHVEEKKLHDLNYDTLMFEFERSKTKIAAAVLDYLWWCSSLYSSYELYKKFLKNSHTLSNRFMSELSPTNCLL